MEQTITQRFLEIYGREDEKAEIKCFFSPGRVNLIGEHTDYNGGYVFPSALTMGTYIAIRKLTNSQEIKLASMNFKGQKTFKISELDSVNKIEKNSEEEQSTWMNYVLGVILEFVKIKTQLQGFELLINGNLPIGAGLSSSASLEVGIGFALNDLFCYQKLGLVDIVKMARSAENNFVGVSCGIMDQFSIGLGKESHALILKCDQHLPYKNIKLDLKEYRIVIGNTNKVRGLADGKYNERVGECKRGVEIINELLRYENRSIECLSDIGAEEFEKLSQSKQFQEESTVLRRCKHVITENDRVLKAVKALESQQLVQFGQLLNESHTSLRYDYEVTGIELDTLVEEAQKIPGVIGSRMTGAGFGGCTVSLVKEEEIQHFIDTVGTNYNAKTGLQADFYVSQVGDGVRILKQEETSKKQQIVVTGGTGYIGSHTVVELIEAGFEAVIIDNLDNSQIDVIDGIEKITGQRPHFEQVDLRNYNKTLAIFQKYPNIAGVIHFAAYKAIGESFQNPLKYYENNLNSLINIMRAMSETKVNNIVFSSSCAVYGKATKLPVTEESPFLPAESPYGHTKQMGEQMLQNYVRSDKTKNVISLRYFNPIGAHPSYHIGELPIGAPLNLVPYVTQTAYGIREQLSIFGGDWETPDGTCIRDYLHVVDLAKAHIIALKRVMDTEKPQNRQQYEYFNLGKGKGYSVLEIVTTFEKVTGVKLNYKITGRRQGDIAEIWADSSLGNKELGWKAEISLEEMLLSAWNWEKHFRSIEKDQQKQN